MAATSLFTVALGASAANAAEPAAWVPTPLLAAGPWGIPWWQWLGLLVVGLAATSAGLLLAKLGARLLRLLALRTPVSWDDDLDQRLRAPLAALGALLIVAAWGSAWGLHQGFESAALHSWRAALLLAFFWILLRLVDVGVHAVRNSSWGQARSAAASLTKLGGRLLKLVVVAAGVVAFMSELGYPVMSMVAGLGVGGIAVALAAQKTVENLFGAFSLGADEPFHVGDFVKLDALVGTVEAIGLRSTRIRTLDRTLVTIPNGKLAELQIESFAARDRLRLACNIGLVYETTQQQMREVLTGFESVLREHPKIWPDVVVVRLAAFGPSSLDVEVMAWFQVTDWGEFQEIRQEVFLQFMKVVEASGSSFAYPTTTVHLATKDADAG